jgi:hypothetical protein
MDWYSGKEARTAQYGGPLVLSSFRYSRNWPQIRSQHHTEFWELPHCEYLATRSLLQTKITQCVRHAHRLVLWRYSTKDTSECLLVSLLSVVLRAAHQRYYQEEDGGCEGGVADYELLPMLRKPCLLAKDSVC